MSIASHKDLFFFATCALHLGAARWEPCGLVQMEAMRLGTLPIVAPTGGLKDTVEAGEMGRNGAGKWPLELVTKWL